MFYGSHVIKENRQKARHFPHTFVSNLIILELFGGFAK